MSARSRMVGLALLTLTLAACAAVPSAVAVAHDWEKATPAPLSARHDAIVVWVAGRYLVLGGDDGRPCPPNADCVVPTGRLLQDGAAYDPGTARWDRITPAPQPVATGTTAVLDDVLYVMVEGRPPHARTAFLSYDAGDDTWARLPLPPTPGRLTAVDGVLVAVPGSDEAGAVVDAWFDPARRTWHALPDDPLGPSFDRCAVAVGRDLILTAKDLVPSPGAQAPALVRMARLDMTTKRWESLPDTELIGSDPVAAAGRIVFPDVGAADGGEVGNWGRPYSLGGVVDPATGRSRPLPEVGGPQYAPRLTTGDLVRVGDSLVDPVTGAATALPHPPWPADELLTMAGSPSSVFAWASAASGDTAAGWLLRL